MREGQAGSGDDQRGDDLAALIGRVALGDRAAFTDLYRRTSAKLFGVCLCILGQRAEAEEALQEVYIALWRRAASFDMDRGRPMTWLITLARNGAIDRLRARRPIAAEPIETAAALPDERPDSAALAEAASEVHRLADCLGQLEAGDHGFIRAAFFQGSTYAELATRAALPLGTVKSRIRRALLKLRECLG